MQYVDEEYIIGIRRKLHQYPEIGYELYKTCEIVKGELDKIGLSYTDKYVPQSIVCDINPEKTNLTIAIRADMDALQIKENTNLPFSSKIEGQMHACGHDAHTAVVLGVTKALYEMKDKFNCRVRVIFQPNEEGAESTPPEMIKNGVLEGVDMILGMHVDNDIDTGKLGFCKNSFMASCRNFIIEVFGKSTHASSPEIGRDALACAVEIYDTVNKLVSSRISPIESYVCEINSLISGNAHNVIPDYAKMLGTIRTHNLSVDNTIFDIVKTTAENNAHNYGCTSKVTSSNLLSPLYNNPSLTEKLMKSAKKIVGEENVAEISKKMISEDFADFSRVIPAVDFMIGTGNPADKERTCYHESNFVIEEKALKYAAETIVQFVLDSNE